MEERYTRQEAVIGKENQKKLSQSRVAIIGLGATGSVTAEMLTRAGIGNLLLVDRDGVDLSNLQRQTLYTELDIGREKALAARERLKQINSKINITALAVGLDAGNIDSVLGGKFELILECTDNLETRFLINEFCRKNKIPAVFCGVAGMKGFVLPVEREFCFNCVFMYAKEALTCSGEGILGATVHLAASLQVKEGIDILLKNKESKLILFDLEKEELEKLIKQAFVIDETLVVKGESVQVSKTSHKEERVLFTQTSTQPSLSDRGEAQLVNGLATIELDPSFLELVELTSPHDLYVQITPTSLDVGGILVVADRSPNGFIVMETNGGKSNATFVWEVTARKKGSHLEKLPTYEKYKKYLIGKEEDTSKESLKEKLWKFF